MMSSLRFAYALVLHLSIQCTALAGPIAEHQGRWLGEMPIPDRPPLRIGADLFTRADGTPWASMSSPDQGVFDIRVASIKEHGDTAELDLGFATLKLTWANGHFDGVYSQASRDHTFALHRVQDFPRKQRPQTPKPPFPYTNTDLSIATPDGAMLGATLSLPRNAVRPNLVVLVPGTGPSTRNDDFAGHQQFVVMADFLARQGIAVLRYDKRGVGRSTGDYARLTTVQLVGDLDAIAKAMKARKQFRRVGMVGMSEGPGIAAAVAARDASSVDFLVSLAGVGISGHANMLLQDRIYARDKGAQPAEVERLMVYVEKFYDAVVAHADPALRIAELKALQAGLSPEDRALVAKYQMNVGSLSLAEAGNAHLRTLLMHDTQEDWRRVAVPVLALNGSLDQQVPAQENLAGIVAALKAGGNAHVEWAVLPSLNHLFQTAKSGSVDEYATIDESFAPAVLSRIAAFVKRLR